MHGRIGSSKDQTKASSEPTKPLVQNPTKTKHKPLWEHQKQTLQLLRKEKKVFDMSDPGTGKTRVAIQAWAERRETGGKCALIIACRRLLQPAWGNDFNEYFPDISYSIAHASNRKEAFDTKADAYITNTDAVKWLAEQPKSFFSKFDTLIIDESTSFKHRTSKRSKAVNKIKKYFEYRELLSGTPNANTILDVWHQMLILDDGKRLGKSFFAFRSAVCTPTQVGRQAHMIRWEDRPHAEQAVTDLIRDISIRHEFDKVMDVPENHVRFITYELDHTHLMKYLKLEKTSVLQLEDGEVVGINAAVLRSKLLQLSSGAVYSTSEDKYSLIDTGRYELAIDLAEERKHSLIFYSWNHQRDQLLKEADKRKIKYAVLDANTTDADTDRITVEFQRGEYQILFMHPKTGAHGLTLTKATTAIVVSPIYEADLSKQIIHRIKRGGQLQKTEILLIEAKDTVERKVFERRMLKSGRMETFLELLTS